MVLCVCLHCKSITNNWNKIGLLTHLYSKILIFSSSNLLIDNFLDFNQEKGMHNFMHAFCIIILCIINYSALANSRKRVERFFCALSELR